MAMDATIPTPLQLDADPGLGAPGGLAIAPATRPGGGLADRATRIAALVAALPGLPIDDGTRYGVPRLTASWLLEAPSPHTEKAYARDLGTFLAWCAQERLDPLTARPADLGQYRPWRQLHGPAGRTAAPSSVARALAAVSSWYAHLVVNTDGAVPRNPVHGITRPPVNRHTSTTA